ncbi:hypothetical protein SFRURICE_004669, partial [Spodoptera frugiperda]
MNQDVGIPSHRFVFTSGPILCWAITHCLGGLDIRLSSKLLDVCKSDCSVDRTIGAMAKQLACSGFNSRPEMLLIVIYVAVRVCKVAEKICYLIMRCTVVVKTSQVRFFPHKKCLTESVSTSAELCVPMTGIHVVSQQRRLFPVSWVHFKHTSSYPELKQQFVDQTKNCSVRESNPLHVTRQPVAQPLRQKCSQLYLCCSLIARVNARKKYSSHSMQLFIRK